MSYPAPLLSHRSHDVPHIVARWRSLARRLRWKIDVIHTAGGFPVLHLQSRAAGDPFYISTGVHGDEAGSVIGLLEWVERRALSISRLPLSVFPLFNPVGLAANTRTDGDGLDLNRTFHRTDHPHIAAWLQATAGRKFRLSACLHEDYDAQGCYCYELTGTVPVADKILAKVGRVLPRDARKNIDGRTATRGVIQRKYPPLNLPGMPEAIALYVASGTPSLTFETPSEFALTDRAAAHGAFLDGVLAEAFA